MLPTVADVLDLEPVKRGAPRVLVAAGRLDAGVRWVHVMELAEAGHLLRGGELVLSTGIALPPDPDGLARYVAGLADAGVSALAVELGSRYVRELPRALVSAASAHRLPLIVLERETQFIAVTEAVHAQILDAQVAELRASQRLHEVFSGLVLAGAPAEEIVRQASVLAGVPVILEDLGHRVLACELAGQEAASLLAGFAARSRGVMVPGRTGYDPASGWLVAAVGTGEADWGRLIFVLGAAPDAAAPVLAERAAGTLALARLIAAGPQSPHGAAHRSLLAAIAGPGYIDVADLEARITALGVPVAGRRLLPVVVQLSGDHVAAVHIAEAIAAASAELGATGLSAPLEEHRVGALLAAPAGADPDAILTRLAGRLRRADQAGCIQAIGAGPAITGLHDARPALREAGDAAGAAAWRGQSVPVARLASLRLAGLVHQLRDDPRVLAFTERELGPLLSHDEVAGTALADVLAVYLECGGNKAKAAQLLGLARPTLYERLRQIEHLLGVSVESAESRLALQAALLARQGQFTEARARGRR
jgi:PucR family transcriptional regulator, purine catabolism regulatory protein